jgi:beta-glucanase (GH16 family)
MALDLTGYHLTYDDEFNSFQYSPDGSTGYKTTFYFGGRSLPSNGEMQYYSDATVGVDPFSLSNGALTITASPGSNPEGLAYNSGLITTEGSFAQQYGYFEARVEVAQGAGMWNGIWMLPTSKAWPPEIDILEAFGADNGRGEGGAYQNHVNSITNDYASGGGGDWIQTPFNIYEGYHTYGVNWQADTTTFYMDGQEIYSVATPSDMHSPMYMLAQLAVGGPWVGSPNGETGQIKLDYLRAYSNDASNAAVALDTISSPDGANTANLYGAVAAGGIPPNPGTGGSTDSGTGANSLTVRVAEDGWNGHAQFTVLVDGQQVGGIQTATASHAAGQWQDITLSGNFATTGAHNVAINFINDGWGGTASTDRNLYVQSVTINGETISGTTAANDAANGSHDASSAVMMVNGTATFSGTGAVTTPAADTLVLRVAEDAWDGHAQFTVTVDGHQVGSTQTASASHASGQWQDITLTGDFGSGPHAIAVNFINDGWGGSSSTDRNLYVQSVSLNGETISGTSADNNAANGDPDSGSAALNINGTALFHATGTGTGTVEPGTGDSGGSTIPTDGTLYLRVAGDDWNGHAQFNVLVDGHQVGGTQTATASHGLGQWQDIALTGDFGAGPHTVDVNFINDGWGGSADTDRNLYVKAIGLNGETMFGHDAFNNAANGGTSADPSAAVMMINGTSQFKLSGNPTSDLPTSSTITLHVAEDAWDGHAQFNVLVDGHQVGDTQTASASHASGQWQDITLTGDFGLTGPGKIDVVFLNDAWGGSADTDRNLYVQSIDVNGKYFAGTQAANTAANGHVDASAAAMDINGTLSFDISHTAAPVAGSDFWHIA